MTVRRKGSHPIAKPYRPGKEVLDLFYDLPELDAAKRHAAIGALLSKLHNDQDAQVYAVERLVTGMASSRAAARIGYTTTLGLLLPVINGAWTVEKFVALADKKLDFKDEATRNGHALAQHLLMTILGNSDVYKQDLGQIVEREMSLYRRFPFLASSITHSLAEMLLSVNTKQFKALITPLKDYITTAVSSSSPEFLLAIFLLRKKHASVLSDLVSFVQGDGSCKFSSGDFDALLTALKKADNNTVNTLIEEIVAAARSGGQLEVVYKSIIDRWATSCDETKVLERHFSAAETTLKSLSGPQDLIAIFSEPMMKRLSTIASGKQTAEKRILKAKVKGFCDRVGTKLVETKDQAQLLEIVTHLDRLGSFDQLTGSTVVEKLLAQLDAPSAVTWVESLSETSARRVGQVFSGWTAGVKEAVMEQLMKRDPTEDLLMTIANGLDSLFYVKVRAGERATIKLSDDNLAILKTAAKAAAPKEMKKLAKKMTNPHLATPLTVLYANIAVWRHLSQSKEEKQAYADALSELETIGSSKEEENVAVLVDLLISLLSQPHKFVRTVVYYVYVSLLPRIRTEEVEHIVEALMTDDEEMGAETAEVDDSSTEMSDDEEESGQSQNEEEEDESEAEEEVDPQLVSRLEQALGQAAVKRRADGDFEEEGSDVSLSDMDDDAMFAMDERLSSVFKAMNPRKEKTQKKQAMQEFRSKVTDLLLFTISAEETPAVVKLHLMVPLIRLSQVQLKRNAEGAVSKRTVELLELLAKQKKLTTQPAAFCSLLDALVNEAAGLTNPFLSSTVSSLAAFVFCLAVSSDGSSSQDVKAAFINLFNKFLHQDEGSLSSELATAAIIKYPRHFISEMKPFVAAGFNEEIRIFRRTEALQCVVALLSKPVVKTHPIDKSAVKKLAKNCADYLLAVGEDPSEVKPRFFATVLKVVSTAAANLSGAARDVLEKIVLPVVEQMIEREDLWKELKKTNSASTQICGKQSLPVMKAIVKSLQ